MQDDYEHPVYMYPLCKSMLNQLNLESFIILLNVPNSSQPIASMKTPFSILMQLKCKTHTVKLLFPWWQISWSHPELGGPQINTLYYGVLFHISVREYRGSNLTVDTFLWCYGWKSELTKRHIIGAGTLAYVCYVHQHQFSGNCVLSMTYNKRHSEIPCACE